MDGDGVPRGHVPDVMRGHGRIVNLVMVVIPAETHAALIGIYDALGLGPLILEPPHRFHGHQEDQAGGQANPGQHFQDGTCNVENSGHGHDGTVPAHLRATSAGRPQGQRGG